MPGCLRCCTSLALVNDGKVLRWWSVGLWSMYGECVLDIHYVYGDVSYRGGRGRLICYLFLLLSDSVTWLWSCFPVFLIDAQKLMDRGSWSYLPWRVTRNWIRNIDKRPLHVRPSQYISCCFDIKTGWKNTDRQHSIRRSMICGFNLYSLFWWKEILFFHVWTRRSRCSGFGDKKWKRKQEGLKLEGSSEVSCHTRRPKKVLRWHCIFFHSQIPHVLAATIEHEIRKRQVILICPMKWIVDPRETFTGSIGLTKQTLEKRELNSRQWARTRLEVSQILLVWTSRKLRYITFQLYIMAPKQYGSSR